MSSSSVEPPLDRTASHTRNLTLCNGERNGWVHLLDKNKRIPPPPTKPFIPNADADVSFFQPLTYYGGQL